MGAAPQTPRYLFPGSEYFSLAPDRSIALGGRRRFQVLNTTAAGAGGTALASATAVLESVFPLTAAIYLHDFWVVVNPQDTSGQMQVTGFSTGLGLASGAPVGNDVAYRLGAPYLTLLSVTVPTTGLSDRDKLICHRDLSPFEAFGDANQLTLSFQVNFKNNDGAAAHTVQVQAGIIYTRLDGILE